MPAVADARNLGRVQGIDSSLGDLKFRDGKKFTLKVGGTVQRTPTLSRTVSGSSSIDLSLRDHAGRFLDSVLLAEKLDAKIDGLDFRLSAANLDPPILTTTLEDRDVARLREFEGPIKVFAKRGQKDETTRAEFVVNSLIRKALGKNYPVTCPQLHDKQPIKSERQGKQAAASAKTDRGKGIGETKGLTVKGNAAKPGQVDLAERVLRVCESHKATDKVMVAAMATIIVENEVSNGGADGLFQVTPETASSHGLSSHDVEACTAEWLTTGFWNYGGAIKLDRENPAMSPGTIAQKAQGSGFPERYEEYAKEAREWVEAFQGGELGGSEKTVTEPYVFEVKKGEDFWTAIKRLAKEVNWRAFFVAGRFYFIDEIELFRGEVRLAIEREPGTLRATNDGIEKVSFGFNTNRQVTDITIIARASHWTVPPGAVITLGGYGPASIGFGDAPVKANSKGERAGLSGARKAGTGEGRARYLVDTIEIPLRDSDVTGVKLVTIKARKPTAPLPEPANATKSASASATTAPGEVTGNATAERMLETAERIASKNPPYVWGGFSESGYDCSGFVSKILDVGGFLQGRLDTKGLAGWGEAGAGAIVTVYVHTGTGSATTEHTIIEIGGKFFQSGGGQNSSPSGGAEEFTPDPSYLAEFNVKRHPKGL